MVGCSTIGTINEVPIHQDYKMEQPGNRMTNWMDKYPHWAILGIVLFATIVHELVKHGPVESETHHHHTKKIRRSK